ncbi:hypothetical protein DFP72DRAFT_869976 [Ephemerocybe angulata]|uniref:Alpha-ketoglutarate-dependent dioxygenase AlkB-like domain-containing protein n=1 Tax=Ephemerocybe angulata TaxID=980116 RepID=A0A8H6IIS0_9AGAR|nr:hypothetical protein DFP72DRAFT_869976 [Tulosesus angulatus]
MIIHLRTTTTRLAPRHLCHTAHQNAMRYALPHRTANHTFHKHHFTTFTGPSASKDIPEDIATFFTFWPSYFSNHEQRILLSSALHRLDSMDSNRPSVPETDDLQQLFASDDLYDFHEGHYDGVIHHYREMHLTSWPVDQFPGLPPVLERLYALCPSRDVQTHLLHLASHGEILPHVDNISASGSWILGVSLGDERTLRMTRPDDKRQDFELSLPSGSVYLQKDQVRYSYEHSIDPKISGVVGKAQRMSIMVRVSLQSLSLSYACLKRPGSTITTTRQQPMS